MKNQRWCVPLATLGPIGYLPASGTCASIIAVLALSAVPTTGWLFIAATFLLLLFSYYAITVALAYFSAHDPSMIVLDELVGCCFVYIGLPALHNPLVLLLGLLLFRFFDIFKPFPISLAEKLPGAYGVLADDIVAGIVANLILQLVIRYV